MDGAGTPRRPSPWLARAGRASPRAAASPSPDAVRALTADLARRSSGGHRPSDGGADEGRELDAVGAVLRALHGAGER
jgi:hypothetical protein